MSRTATAVPGLQTLVGCETAMVHPVNSLRSSKGPWCGPRFVAACRPPQSDGSSQ